MELPATCQCLVGFLAAVLFLYASWRSWSTGDEKGGLELSQPPEPGGAWPVVGHLPLLRGKEIAARRLGRMADKYGPIFMLRLGVHRILVVSSHEAAKECFTARDREFASRPRTAAGKYLGYDHTVIAFVPCGSLLREKRKVATTELLSSSRLDKLRHIWASEIDTRMRELYDLFAGGHRKVEMRRWFNDITFNVIVRMVVGRRYFSGASDGDAINGGEFAQMRRFQKAVTELLYLAGMFVPSDFVPCVEWLDLYGYIKAMKRTARDLDAVLDTWIEEHRRKRRSKSGKSTAEEGDVDHFVDVMLSATEGADPSTGFARLGREINDIKATVLGMVIGGTDTAAITMTWALALLLNHRRVLDKVREELDLHVGMARHVDDKDICNLVYLQAVLKETLRLYPAAPLSVPHESIADCRIGGYHVPAGTRLLTNLWKLHRDPRVWEEPLEFRPERFLGGGETAEVEAGWGQHFEYMPFGSGRRMCPGSALALQVMQLTLARLIHGFDVATPDGEEVDMGEGLGVTLPKAAPLEVLFNPRLRHELYYCA